METEGRALTSSKDAAVARDGEKRTSQASRFSNVRAVSSKRAQCQAGRVGMGEGVIWEDQVPCLLSGGLSYSQRASAL